MPDPKSRINAATFRLGTAFSPRCVIEKLSPKLLTAVSRQAAS
jgi:hypothetical protein